MLFLNIFRLVLLDMIYDYSDLIKFLLVSRKKQLQTIVKWIYEYMFAFCPCIWNNSFIMSLLRVYIFTSWINWFDTALCPSVRRKDSGGEFQVIAS